MFLRHPPLTQQHMYTADIFKAISPSLGENNAEQLIGKSHDSVNDKVLSHKSQLILINREHLVDCSKDKDICTELR